jgi:type I restriction enzyme R subunit
LLADGYTRVEAKGFDRERAIFPTEALAFIQATQAKVWEKLEALHGEQTGVRVLESLCKWLDTHGTLATLRHGFKCFRQDAAHRLLPPRARPEPGAGGALSGQSSGPDPATALQPTSEKSLDVVLSVNGIPVVTLELKNPLSGQTVANAIHQYRHDRDPREPIFEFTKRTLVHFAVDTEEAHMATRWRVRQRTSCLSTGVRTVAPATRPTGRAQLQDGLPLGRSAAA